jgi:hypothetical protein
VDGASLRDLHEAGPLLTRQVSGELDVPFDPVDAPLLRLAVRAVSRVDLRVPKTNRDFPERPALSSRVQRDLIDVQEPSAASSKS